MLQKRLDERRGLENMSKKKKAAPVEKIRLSGRNIYTDKKGRDHLL